MGCVIIIVAANGEEREAGREMEYVEVGIF